LDYSLPYQDEYGFCKILMSAIGGDGANTVGKMIFELGVNEFNLDGGYDAKYGSEKTGTPTSVSIRLCPDDVEVRTSGPTQSPHILVGFYLSVLKKQGFHKNLPEGATVAINTKLSPEEIRDEIELYSGKIITLDAGKIVDETGSRLNMPMLWLLARELDYPFDAVENAVAKKWPSVKETNLAAFNRAEELYEEQTFEPKEEYKNIQSKEEQPSPIGYENMPYGGSLPSRYFLTQPHPERTHALGIEPQFDPEICIHCGNCVLNCPDPGAIVFEDGAMKGINADICKRCMRCTLVCPETKKGKALVRPSKTKEEAK